MDPEDHKMLARIRREKQLKAMQDGHDFRTRIVSSKKRYQRAPKYKPQTASEWEKVELWP